MRFSSIRQHTYRLTHARLKKTELPAAIPNKLQVIQEQLRQKVSLSIYVAVYSIHQNNS